MICLAQLQPNQFQKITTRSQVAVCNSRLKTYTPYSNFITFSTEHRQYKFFYRARTVTVCPPSNYFEDTHIHTKSHMEAAHCLKKQSNRLQGCNLGKGLCLATVKYASIPAISSISYLNFGLLHI